MRALYCCRLLFLAAVMLPLQACSNSYSAKAIEAWVVEADTGKPLEGVNAVAYWELRYGIEGGGSYQLTIMETVTDQNGRLYFPTWGPKQVPAGLPSETRLKDSDPAIVLFKSGYESRTVTNNRPITSMSGHGASVRTSEWNGKSIPLRKFNGPLEKYAFNVRGLMSSLHFVKAEKNCEWQRLPRMIVALSREVKMLKEQKMTFLYFPIDSIDDLPHQAECGNARQFFKEYMQ